MIISGEFITRAPISHISEAISTGTLLNERELMQENGEIEPVFCYNANAWAGQLRDNMAKYLLSKVEIKNQSVENFHFIFAGGKIGGASKFDLKMMREYFEILPMFALRGGCLNNMPLPSKMTHFDSLPICKEAIVELPPKTHEDAINYTYRDMTIEVENSTFDDSKNMRLNDGIADDDKVTIQMRYSNELLNSGVRLSNMVTIDDDARDSEIGAFCSALEMFAKFPFIGGQHNKGRGKVDLEYFVNDKPFFSVKHFTMKPSELFNKYLSAYDAHLKENAEKIAELLA